MTSRYRLSLIRAIVLCVFTVAWLASCREGGGIIPRREREPEIDEEQAHAHLQTASDFMKSGKPAHANHEFKFAIESNYRLFPAHIGYQDSFFSFFNPEVPSQARQKDEMLKAYEKYAKDYPSEAMFQYLYGRMLDKTDRPREAARYFKRAVELNERYYPAHASLARFYEEADKSPALAKYHRDKSEKYRAIHELRSRLAERPHDIAVHRQYQDMMLAAEKSNDVPSGTVLEEYRRLLKEATGEGKREARHLYLYGRLLGRTGDLEEAREQFERASLLDENLPWPYDGLGTYYIHKSQEKGVSAADVDDYIAAAVRMFEKAGRKGPGHVTIQLKLAEIYSHVAALRLQGANDIRSRAQGAVLSEADQRRTKELLREAYRRSNDCKATLMGLINEGSTDARVYRQLATLMLNDGCYFLARQTALAGAALLTEYPPADPSAAESLQVRLTGIYRDCGVYITRLEEDRDTSTLPFPQLFFKGEFRARMKSESAAFRARTVDTLARFYVQVMQDREKIDPAILPDYEQMQEDALVQAGLALEDGDDEVRIEAVSVLGLLRVEPFCENIGAVLVNPEEDEELRKEAAIALGNMKAAGAVRYLIKGIQDEDADVREQSANSLGKLGVQTFGFNFDDKPSVRAKKVEEIENWWLENKETHKVPET